MFTMRGIVISPVKILGKNSMLVNSGIDPVDLRRYLLYWDKIDFPQNNIIGFSESPEISYLRNVGVLQQTNVSIQTSGELTELYSQAQLEALKLNNERDKGCWSLAQSNAHLVLPNNDSELKRTIEVDLYDCLPIPSAEVNLEDILEFKQRRNDELQAFRIFMDELYLEICNSPDPEKVKLKNIDKLKKSIVDLHKVTKESFVHRLLGSLKVEFDISDMIKNTVGGAGIGALFHFPIEYGALLGLASSIKVSCELNSIPKKLPSELKDFAYLYYAEKEFI